VSLIEAKAVSVRTGRKAQLQQICRATLRVVVKLAKSHMSLEITENVTIRYNVLFVYHC